MKTIALLTFFISALASGAPQEPLGASGVSNGGGFTDSVYYDALHRIVKDLKYVESLNLDMGPPSKEVTENLEAGDLVIFQTDAALKERKTGAPRDALNFNRNLTREEARRFKAPESLMDKRLILVNRNAFQERVQMGISVDRLLAHELWGAMGQTDGSYVQTRKFFQRIQDLRNSRHLLREGTELMPAKWNCHQLNEQRFLKGLMNGYGKNRRDLVANVTKARTCAADKHSSKKRVYLLMEITVPWDSGPFYYWVLEDDVLLID